jgi:anti-anti-sigma factor
MSLSVDWDLADARQVRLSGELDTFNARDLVEALAPLVGQGGPLSLDVSQVAFVDSGGIRAITLLAKAMGDRGELILVSPKGEVARLMELVGIATLPNVRILPGPEAVEPGSSTRHVPDG